MYCDLWSLVYDLWIVDRSTARDFTVFRLSRYVLARKKAKRKWLDTYIFQTPINFAFADCAHSTNYCLHVAKMFSWVCLTAALSFSEICFLLKDQLQAIRKSNNLALKKYSSKWLISNLNFKWTLTFMLAFFYYTCIYTRSTLAKTESIYPKNMTAEVAMNFT